MIMSSHAFHFLLVLAAACTAVTYGTNEVNLGTAEEYVILTKAGISTVPDSSITGNIAVSPIAGTAMTGFSLAMTSDGKHSTSTQVVGSLYAANFVPPTPSLLTVAIGDMMIAYTDASSRDAEGGKTEIGGGILGGEIGGSEANALEAGVYTFSTAVTIEGDLYIKGGEDDVFILRTTKFLEQVKDTEVHLIGGIKAKNIIWQVAENVVIGDRAHMEGILLVKTAIEFRTESSLDGRVFSQTACTLQMATITQPVA